MATRFYLPASAAAAVSPAISSEWEHVQTDRRQMDTAKVDSSFATTDYSPDSADHIADQDSHFIQFISRPLAAQTITAQTVSITIIASETNNGNNCSLTWKLFLCSNDGSSVDPTPILAITRDGTELANALQSRTDSATSTSRTAAAGDRIVLEVGIGGLPSETGGVQGHNGSLRCGDPIASEDLAAADGTITDASPWVLFETDTLAFAQSATPTPDLLLATLSLPAAVVVLPTNATVIPATLVAIALLPTPAVLAENPNATVSPPPLVGTLSVPAPTIVTGSSRTVTPSAADTQVVPGDPVVLIGNRTVEVEQVEATASLPAATARMLQLAHPVADLEVGNWTTQAGLSTSLFAVIAEPRADDADYVRSATSPGVANEVKVRLSPVPDPSVSSGHVVRYRYGKDAVAGDPLDLTVTLYAADGTTAIASTSHTGVAGPTTIGALTLTAPQADAISTADYETGLVLGFSAVSSVGGAGDQWDFSSEANSAHILTAGVA